VFFSPGGAWYAHPPHHTTRHNTTNDNTAHFPQYYQAWCTSLQELITAKNVTNVNLICSPVEWKCFGMVCLVCF
jgi:hypothetical protein